MIDNGIPKGLQKISYRVAIRFDLDVGAIRVYELIDNEYTPVLSVINMEGMKEKVYFVRLESWLQSNTEIYLKTFAFWHFVAEKNS